MFVGCLISTQNLLAQIDYEQFNGAFGSLPNFSTLTPDRTGTVDEISLSASDLNDNFALVFTTTITSSSSSSYTFRTTSDDGSKLFVDGTLVVDNDGLHGPISVEGSLFLDAGEHLLRVEYFERGGGETLRVDYMGGDILSFQPIPDDGVVGVSDAGTLGSWGPIIEWPLNPASVANLPDGRLVSWTSIETNASPATNGPTFATVFDPVTSTFTESNNDAFHNMFCASISLLEDGSVMVNGGIGDRAESSVFSFESSSWSSFPPMQRLRYYGTSLTLPDNNVFVSWARSAGNTSELYDTATDTWNLTPNVTQQVLVDEQNAHNRAPAPTGASPMQWYAHLSVAPNGRVLHAGPAQSWHFFDPMGGDSNESLGQPSGDRVRTFGNLVNYDYGKVMLIGGLDRREAVPISAEDVFLVDLNGATPLVTRGPAMNFGRSYSNSVTLPDGTILVLGGNTDGKNFSDVGSRFVGEVYNPVTNLWSLTAPSAVPRNYHSVAILMKDGRVLSAGGGSCGSCSVNHEDGQIFSPAYLFNDDDTLRVRPEITSAPAVVTAGTQMSVTASATTARFTVVRLSGTTHHINADQRFLPLDSVDNGSGNFVVSLPANPNVLLPGFYWLFSLDATGTPSVGQTIQVVRDTISPPTATPTVLFRVNAAGDEVASVDSGPAWQADGVYLIDAGSDRVGPASLTPNASVPSSVPAAIFDSERWDQAGGTEMQYGFPVDPGDYEVNLYMGNTYGGTNRPGLRVFDVAIEGVVPTSLNDIDLVDRFGNRNGARLSYVTSVTDGQLNIEFIHGVENPLINGIEIIAQGTDDGSQGGMAVSPLAAFPRQSGTLIVEQHNGLDRIWNVNPDNDSVSVSDPTGRLLAEIPVGEMPWSIGKSPQSSHVFATNKGSGTISIINSNTLTVESTINLQANSQPHGIIFNNAGTEYYVLHEATGVLERRNANSHGVLGRVTLDGTPRHLSMTFDDSMILVSNFITPMVTGEESASIDLDSAAAQIFAVDPIAMVVMHTIDIPHDDTPFGEFDGPGLPNYLGPAAFTSDSLVAYIPHKKDNIDSGLLRGSPGMSFDHTVRAQTSRIELGSASADRGFTLDHDNSSVATSVALSGDNRYLLVTLETSRELVVYDLSLGFELLRAKTGRAPQTVALSSDSTIAYVHNFMDRSVSRFDLTQAFADGVPSVAELPIVDTVGQERLSPQVLLGKQLFYDADDTRLARDGYMSCASCHKEGKHDGRVWDLTQFGEGLRNTTSLRGKAGTAQGFLHWTGNFDEVQDFEGQIRDFAGGTGLMSDTLFNSGTRNQPLGQAKAGASADLDALAAYLVSLQQAELSPYRASGGDLTDRAELGRQLFSVNNCASCHAGSIATDSPTGNRSDVGTIDWASGNRLGGFLDGFDTPSLLGIWASEPYLHDGSENTIAGAIRAHSSLAIGEEDAQLIAEFLRQLDARDLE